MKWLKKVKINRRYVFYAVLLLLFMARLACGMILHDEYPFGDFIGTNPVGNDMKPYPLGDWFKNIPIRYIMYGQMYLSFAFGLAIGLCMTDVETIRIKNFKVTWQSLVRAAVVAMISWLLYYPVLWRLSNLTSVMPQTYLGWFIGVNIPAIFFRRGMEANKAE